MDTQSALGTSRGRSTAVRIGLVVGIASSLLAVPATSHAAFPGTNGRIVFGSARAGGVGVFGMAPDGSNQVHVAGGAGDGSPQDPAFSPDAMKVAYQDSGQIGVMNADGTERQLYGDDPGGFITGFNPSFSPDGQRIVFDRAQNSTHWQLWLRNADGTGPDSIHDSSTVVSHAVFSPDGTKLAFSRSTTTSEADFDIAVATYNGIYDITGVVNLTNNAAQDMQPTFAPDGSKIAFASNRDGNLEIFVMNADGSSPTQLTETVGEVNQHPSFSPDGTMIAFERRSTDHDGEIYVMNVDGSGQTNISNNPANEANPDWGPAPASSATSASATQTTSLTLEAPPPPPGVLTVSVQVDDVGLGSLQLGASVQADAGDITYENTQAGGTNWSGVVAATSMVNGSAVVPFRTMSFTPGTQISGEGSQMPSPGTAAAFSGSDPDPGTSFSDPITLFTAPGSVQGTFTQSGSTVTVTAPADGEPGTYTGTLQYTITG